jgi:protein-tyrosine phosphatase
VGKDRTGVLAAILLSVLGVHPSVVADDYALSAAAMVRLNEYFVATFPDAVDVMAKQPKEFMAAPVGAMHRFLETMDQTYGSAEAYVRSIGIEDDTLSALRTALLEQP